MADDSVCWGNAHWMCCWWWCVYCRLHLRVCQRCSRRHGSQWLSLFKHILRQQRNNAASSAFFRTLFALYRSCFGHLFCLLLKLRMDPCGGLTATTIPEGTESTITQRHLFSTRLQATGQRMKSTVFQKVLSKTMLSTRPKMGER